MPRQITENGLTDALVRIENDELRTLIEGYTMESGVRNLERSIAAVCRVVAYRYAISSEPTTFNQVTIDNSII